MDEAGARAWVESRFDVPRETMERLDRFVLELTEAGRVQNLVSKASLADIWSRHIADSAQLVAWAPGRSSSWVDLGTGAGFPGLIVAALHNGPVTLIEERRLRVDFLRRAALVLGAETNTEILGASAQRARPRPFDAISARAFAPLPRLLELGTRFSTPKTRWILPKGRNARSELEALEPSWQGDFRIEASVTDPDAGIIIAEGVERKRA